MDDVAVKRGTLELMAMTAQLVTNAPRTRRELLELTGISDVHQLARYLRAYEAEGLIEVSGRRRRIGSNGRMNGPGAIEYRWVRAVQE